MRFLEWYLNLPDRPESEDVGWRLVLERTAPTTAWGWTAASAILLLAVVSLVGYVRQSRELPRRLRALLLGLRLAAVLLVMLLLAGVGLTAQLVGRPKLVLLIDVSASMSTPDLERPDPDDDDLMIPADRLTAALDRLLEDDGHVLRDLAERYRIRIYQFGADAELIASIDTPESVADAISRLSSLEPSASATQPATAVDTVLRDLRGQSIASIVAITDGVSSTGPDVAWTTTIDGLNESGTPLAAVPVGAETPRRDLQIIEAHLPESAWIGQPVTFLVQVRLLGAAGREVAVELRRAGSDELVDTASIAVGADDVREWVSLSLTPDEAGQFEYEARIAAIEDELITDNNHAAQSIDVRQGTIRVLLVERTPRWEYRHLKAVLERDELVELHTVLLWADTDYAQEDSTALPGFPATREELLGAVDSGAAIDATGADAGDETSAAEEDSAGYDVIIWGDVDPESLPPDALSHLQDFVRVKGGGVVMIAGADHNPWSYFDTPAAPLLPFPREGVTVPPRPPGVPAFQQARTLDAESFGFLRLDNDPEWNHEIWEDLPPQHWLLPIEEVKPGAQVLATHAAQRGGDGLLPTVIHQRYGAGQVVYLATDEFWQWRAGVEDLYLGRFWSQIVRSMAPHAPDESASHAAGLVSLQPVYAEDEPVAFRMSFTGGLHFPSDGNGEVVIERETIVMQRVELSPSVRHPNSLEGTGTPLPAGSYRAWLADPSLPGEVPSCRFDIDAGRQELAETVVDLPELERAARETNGPLIELDDVPRLSRLLPRGRRVPVAEVIQIPLWSRPEALLLLTLLLGCEWSLRRRHRLT